jgi:hypothetical protein
MKLKLTVAFIFFATGTATLVDWIIFAEKNKQVTNHKVLVDKYFARFPNFLERLFAASSSWHAVLVMVLFSIAGLIFVSQKKRAYTILGIISFLFASWNLWSLM